MATRQEFCDAMEEVYRNHGVYIGTANGEYTEKLTIEQIVEMEIAYGYDTAQTHKNIGRDFRYIAKCFEQGWDMRKSRAGDCSGIVVGVMRDPLHIIKESADYNCRTFQQACAEVPLKDLQPGDLMFNKKQTGEKSTASHMGVYVGNDMVIESRGRDYGVVKRKTSEGGWAIGGRLDWFSDEIPVLTRELKYIENDLMHGTDVKQCQERLVIKGYNPGLCDGYYGRKTEDAVMNFQVNSEDLHIKRLGVVGQKTWAKLWE